MMSACSAEPMKRKKRVDPQQEQNRIRRKTRRIEKEIKRLTKQGKKLKPVEEIEGDRQLMKEEHERRRPPQEISSTEADNRVLLLKEWARFQSRVARAEEQKLSTVIAAQQRALRALALLSPHHLYAAAIKPTASEALHLHTSGPYATPPPRIAGQYEAPDGEIIDKTPTFEYDFELDRRLLAETKRNKFVKISAKKPTPVEE
uniref:Large ribosomal subunit protein mL40 n=1 Tax=Mesocestoides corti TaxID=53468 RepID=A0A5K3F1X8_MESCO